MTTETKLRIEVVRIVSEAVVKIKGENVACVVQNKADFAGQSFADLAGLADDELNRIQFMLSGRKYQLKDLQ